MEERRLPCSVIIAVLPEAVQPHDWCHTGLAQGCSAAETLLEGGNRIITAISCFCLSAAGLPTFDICNLAREPRALSREPVCRLQGPGFFLRIILCALFYFNNVLIELTGTFVVFHFQSVSLKITSSFCSNRFINVIVQISKSRGCCFITNT